MVRFLSAGLVASVAFFAGCDSKPTQQPATNNNGTVPGPQKDDVVDALTKAGIASKPAAIFDDGDVWTVTLTPDGVDPDGKMSGPPKMPEQVSIDKKSKKVTRQGQRGGAPGGGNSGSGFAAPKQ